MSKSLLIVESPTKAKTLQKYLGSDFVVRSSKGHIRDLPKNELGVDLKHDFEPTYVTILGKAKVIQELKKAAAGIRDIYLGPDPDREGEAIAWHIAEALGENHRFHRVLLMELTPKGIREALAHPVPLNRPRYESQQARRILDRLVGYQISPLLWKKVKTGLSAGRVQSVALRLVVDRERAIAAFVPEEYWSLTACLAAAQPPAFEARLVQYQGKEVKIGSAAQVDEILEALEGVAFRVSKVGRKSQRRHPAPPFITSSLQMEANRKLRFPPKRTMQVAQRLYEGVELGDEGPVGLITYMRTDSTRVAADAVEEARKFIGETFGAPYLPKSPPRYKSPKGAQEAHEAIRPTSVLRRPEAVKAFLSKDELALYELIWRRFVASQMAPAVYQVTTVEVAAGDYLFRASASVLEFPGFTLLYQETPETPEQEPEAKLPPVTVGEVLELKDVNPQRHFTKPPPRFTEASLIRELEVQGIGRPSTYATILSNLQDRNYVLKEKSGLRPTRLGMVVSDLLVQNFPDIMDTTFTARMESDLDRIAEAQLSWRQLLRDFYGPFSRQLERAKEAMPAVKRVPTGLSCPTCGAELVVRWGKNGEFVGCSAYPACTFTANFTVDSRGQIVLLPPEAAGAFPCPQEGCGGTLVRRRSRRGTFYGCNRYPDCRFLLNKEPVPQPCPECDFPWMVKKGRKLVCPREACGYSESQVAEAVNE
ncbi:MAG: type I DNA topoisomerase [Syntrophobacterales bacterium]|nr:type I DNA topoisomerase [Syntrophobacterales bacterium]